MDNYQKLFIYLLHQHEYRRLYLNILDTFYRPVKANGSVTTYGVRTNFLRLSEEIHGKKLLKTLLFRRRLRSGEVNPWERSDRAYFKLDGDDIYLVYQYYIGEDGYTDRIVMVGRAFINRLFKVMLREKIDFKKGYLENGVWFTEREHKNNFVPATKIIEFVSENSRVMKYVLNELLLKPPKGVFPGGVDYFKIEDVARTI